MGKINLYDRYTDGSAEPSLSPKLVNTEMNAKLGPRFPVTKEPRKEQRRTNTGLPPNLVNKG